LLLSGTDVVHYYTVIPPSLFGDHPNQQSVSDGHAVFMMIKIYRDGFLTPQFISLLRPGLSSPIESESIDQSINQSIKKFLTWLK